MVSNRLNLYFVRWRIHSKVPTCDSCDVLFCWVIICVCRWHAEGFWVLWFMITFVSRRITRNTDFWETHILEQRVTLKDNNTKLRTEGKITLSKVTQVVSIRKRGLLLSHESQRSSNQNPIVNKSNTMIVLLCEDLANLLACMSRPTKCGSYSKEDNRRYIG